MEGKIFGTAALAALAAAGGSPQTVAQNTSPAAIVSTTTGQQPAPPPSPTELKSVQTPAIRREEDEDVSPIVTSEGSPSDQPGRGISYKGHKSILKGPNRSAGHNPRGF